MLDVDINPPRRETHRRATQDDGRARDLRLDDRQALRERVIRVLRRRVRPEQIGEIVARELLAGVERKTDQQRQMLARTERHLFTGDGEQGGRAEAVQPESVSHVRVCVLLIRYETLGGRINHVSTR